MMKKKILRRTSQLNREPVWLATALRAPPHARATMFPESSEQLQYELRPSLRRNSMSSLFEGLDPSARRELHELSLRSDSSTPSRPAPHPLRDSLASAQPRDTLERADFTEPMRGGGIERRHRSLLQQRVVRERTPGLSYPQAPQRVLIRGQAPPVINKLSSTGPWARRRRQHGGFSSYMYGFVYTCNPVTQIPLYTVPVFSIASVGTRRARSRWCWRSCATGANANPWRAWRAMAAPCLQAATLRTTGGLSAGR